MKYDTSFKSVKDRVSPEEWQARVELAACYRLVDQYEMTDLIYNHITARIPGTEHLLINLYGLLYKEITASSLVKIDAEGEIITKPDTDYGINKSGYVIHGAIHKGRPDVSCIIHTHTLAGMAVSAMKCGILPVAQSSMRFSDIAYHENKRERGFDRLIDVWGADHHGYVQRTRAAFEAMGGDPERLELLIMQFVNLQERMSKRAGTVVTMEDLVGAVGVDAARYSLIRSSVDSTLDVDLDLLVRRSNDNPVFYVQYAHARLASLARNAADLGLTAGTEFGLLVHPREGDLIRTLGEFPSAVRAAAENARNVGRTSTTSCQFVFRATSYVSRCKAASNILSAGAGGGLC